LIKISLFSQGFALPEQKVGAKKVELKQKT